MRLGRLSLLAGGLAAAVMLAACAIPVAPDTVSPGQQQTGQQQPLPREPVRSPLPNGMAADEQAAVRATNEFWKGHFQQLFGSQYQSPRIEGGYLGSDGPPCGGSASVPFNAFYCQPSDFIAWDENLMSAGYKQIGDAWVYLIISHEWGHAIAARIDRSLVSVAAELQADCLAGATLAGAQADGTITLEAGDAKEISRTLAAVADDFPWTQESDHGNARQRIVSFNTGARGGPQACLGAAR